MMALLLSVLPQGTGLHVARQDGAAFLRTDGKPCPAHVTPVPTAPPPGPPPLVPGAPPPLTPLKVLPKLSPKMLPKLGPLPTPVPMPPAPTRSPPIPGVSRIMDGVTPQPTDPPEGTIFIPGVAVGMDPGQWVIP